MQRYFVSELNWTEDSVKLTEDYHHIVRVMRYEVGDTFTCVHPNKRIALCQIEKIDEAEKAVYASIIETLKEDTELPIHVTIMQSLPKGNKLEWIIQKGTELGASLFILFPSERSVVKWDEKKVMNRLKRYEKIAKEASEQSKRTIIPQIIFMKSLEEYVENNRFHSSMQLIAYEEEAKADMANTFGRSLLNLNEGESLTLCIGPEGGFTDNEIAFLKKHSFQPVRLGKRILRTETASLYALAALSYHFEESE